MNIEKELEKALERKSPPAGFAGRVLDRIHHETAEGVIPPKRAGSFRTWILAASVILAILLGAVVRREIVEKRLRAEGEWAKEQVMLAMQIASDKTNIARDNVRESARSRNEKTPKGMR